jgi:AAA domain, putative AbiEii toxin, Type IV TA system
MWFLARADANATVVLDEPDVYMHPDLQRRLLELVRDRFAQLVIATHSIEIISDVDPTAILSINKQRASSRFVTTQPGVQTVIDGLGGVHNVQITRLFTVRRFLFVEGDDVKLLRILQKKAAPAAEPIDLIPHGELGGRSGWLSGLPERVASAGDPRITTYCLLDRDYFPQDEVDERYDEARRWRVNLRVWSRKELENFLLVPDAIVRTIEQRLRSGVAAPPIDAVAGKIDELVEAQREVITDAFATTIWSRDRRGGLTQANRLARNHVQAAWAARDSRWALSPGKTIISGLSGWAQNEYGVSFGPDQIARSLLPGEVPNEIANALAAVVAGKRFD